MHSESDRQLRNRLVRHVKGGEAFSTIDRLLEKVSFDQTGIIPEGLPYSIYQQLYHIRYAQLDILDYCRDENYRESAWPDDYWPKQPTPADEQEWKDLISNFKSERQQLCDLILDPSNDLFQPVASTPDHTLLREIQLVIEHTAYHTGELYVIYRLLNS